MADEFDVLTPVRDDLYTPKMVFDGGETSEERIVRLTYEKSPRVVWKSIARYY